MGVMYEMEEVINRTNEPLNVRFDGQDTVLDPNYDAEGKFLADVHNIIPKICVPYAKSQNILNGSEDPEDPSDYVELVAVLAKSKWARTNGVQRDDISFCPQDHDEPTRVRLEDLLDDPTLKILKGGKMKPVRGTSARKRQQATDAAPFDIVPSA